jgi:Cu+-exporting ATPase
MSKTTRKAKGIFRIIGMHCPSCAGIVSKMLYKLDGIISVNINYITDKVYIEYEPSKVSVEEIRKVIEKAGYKAYEASQSRTI